MQTFWMVNGAKNRPGRFKHWTLESAEKEAKRLADLNPGRPYFICQCVGFAWTPEPKPSAVYTAPKAHVDTPAATE